MEEFPLLIVLCMLTSNLAMASLENPISNRCGIGHKLVQSNFCAQALERDSMMGTVAMDVSEPYLAVGSFLAA